MTRTHVPATDGVELSASSGRARGHGLKRIKPPRYPGGHGHDLKLPRHGLSQRAQRPKVPHVRTAPPED